MFNPQTQIANHGIVTKGDCKMLYVQQGAHTCFSPATGLIGIKNTEDQFVRPSGTGRSARGVFVAMSACGSMLFPSRANPARVMNVSATGRSYLCLLLPSVSSGVPQRAAERKIMEVKRLSVGRVLRMAGPSTGTSGGRASRVVTARCFCRTGDVEGCGKHDLTSFHGALKFL